MIYRIFAVRDRAADVFGTPHFAVSTGAAIRSFTDEVNRDAPENTLARHPEDFDLYELGSFNDGDASFELVESPRQVAIGKDVKVRSNGSA
jgi:hypothetical protein